MTKPLNFEPTQRGFLKAEFTDRYGEKCSLQESSLATEAAIWLGIDEPQPKMMARYAPDHLRAPANDPERLNGWVDVPLPEGASISSRMHLTQTEVRELLPALTLFAETGYLPRPEGETDGGN
jgi:hypothetical protein